MSAQKHQNIINVIFEVAHGQSDISSMEAATGQPIPRLPAATRKGFTFVGWYTDPKDGEKICSGDTLTSRTDLHLYAHFEKIGSSLHTGTADGVPKKKSSLKTQRIAVLAILCLVVILAVTIPLVIKYIVNVTSYEDSDGKLYYIKKDSGIYALYNEAGEKLTPHVYSTEADSSTSYSSQYYSLGESTFTYYIMDSGNQLSVDSQSGDYSLFAVVDTDEGEVVGYNTRIMMYAQIEQTNIHSIEVHNTNGTYRLTTNRNASGINEITFTGYEDIEGLSYDAEVYANVCVASGYTLSYLRLDKETVDEHGYEEYGFLVDSEGNVSSFNYFVVTERLYNEKNDVYASGEPGISHKVYLGDATPSGDCYYAKLDGRDTIYLLTNSLVSCLFDPLTAMLDAHIAYPMSTSTYYNVDDFYLWHCTYTDDTQTKETADKNCQIAFTFIPLEDRQNTLYSSVAFRFVDNAYTYKFDNYQLNTTSANNTLTYLCYFEADEIMCVKPSEDDLKLYGLAQPAYYITYTYNESDSLGNIVPHDCQILISEKVGSQYYAYSYFSDMILAVDESQFRFLEYTESDWIDSTYTEQNISFVNTITLTSKGKTITFTLDDSWSDPYDFERDDNDVHQAQDYESITTLSNGNYKVTYWCYQWAGQTGEEDAGIYRVAMYVTLDEEGEVVGYTMGDEIYKVEKDEEATAFIHALKNYSYQRINYQLSCGAITEEVAEKSMSNAEIYGRMEIYWDINAEMFAYDTQTGAIYSSDFSGTTEFLNLIVTTADGTVTYHNADKVKVKGTSTYTGEYNQVLNFRYWYQEMLTNTMEEVDLTEEEMAALRAKDDSECLLIITMELEDFAAIATPDGTENNTRTLTYRFYQYSDRRCYMTINGQGEYYCLATYVKKMMSDAEKVYAGEDIDRYSKY